MSGESVENTTFLECLVQLLSCLNVMKIYLLLLKLLLETGLYQVSDSYMYIYIYLLAFDELFRLSLCSLFHVVVETDEISTQVIRHLNAEKGGRVTFIPLNRVKAPHVTYPRSSDVIPLLKKLKYSPNYDQAFSQVSNRP